VVEKKVGRGHTVPVHRSEIEKMKEERRAKTI
jgi:hypothetical protein